MYYLGDNRPAGTASPDMGARMLGDLVRRLSRTAIIATSLFLAAPPAFAQFGNFLQQLVPNLPGQQQSPAAGQPPVNQMQGDAGKAGSLGTDAVALVEEVTGAPDAGVQFMDYVFAGQVVNLGPKGALKLSYLSGCREEEVSGGTVTIDPKGSQVSGGQMKATEPQGCNPPKPVVAASATEAGATVNRVTPFSGQNWYERTVKSARPVFRWNYAGAAQVYVVFLDKKPEETVWMGQAEGEYLDYPADAPALQPGRPYRVDIVSNGAVVHTATFSIDPGLDVPDTRANRLVDVSVPRG